MTTQPNLTDVRFSSFCAQVALAKLLVVGDVMLDRYWFGEVTRISPEAPVPVVRVSRVEERPGGAANVARNCAALGAQTRLLSVIGADEASSGLGLRNVRELLEILYPKKHKLCRTQ